MDKPSPLLTEYERRAIFYLEYFYESGNIQGLWGYLYWRACAESGKEYAQENFNWVK